MKKILFSLFVIALGINAQAQSSLFVNLKKIVHDHYPELQLDDKIIAFNVWSVADPESRELNKSFEKTFAVYQFARLKGGNDGMIVVAINRDNLSPEATITLTKDGVTKIISLKAEEVQFIKAGANYNIVYDSIGREIYKDLVANQVYPSINKLITR